MTPEELALLTDEERAGLEEDHDEGHDDDEGSDDDADAGGTDTDADDDAGDDQQAAGRDDGADPAAAADQPGADEGEAPLPLMQVKAVEGADEKLAAIDKREDEASQKFEDGDLTTAEYRAELRALEKERGAIERQQLEADLAASHNQAQIDARWEANVMTFLEQHPEIDPKKPLLWNSFDQAVRAVTAETMKGGNNPGMADLKKAYQNWSEELGFKPAAAADKDAGKDKGAKEPKPKRELPPTLANLPASDINDTDDGKWAGLDRLMDTDPMAYEKAFARLSEADQDAYLASR